jgi:hypothetical protein
MGALSDILAKAGGRFMSGGMKINPPYAAAKFRAIPYLYIR